MSDSHNLDYKPPWADAFDRAFDPRGKLSVWSLATWGNQPARYADELRARYPEGVPISGKQVEPDDLITACYEQIPRQQRFRSPQSCTYYMRAIAERCILDECWPDEEPERMREDAGFTGFKHGRIE